MSNVLWSGGSEGKKIQWVKWDEVCKDHRFGGLGVKELEWFNKALMTKWLWRFLTESNTLWVRVVKACKGNIMWDGRGFGPEENRRIRPGWWKKVLGLSRGEEGKWLRDNLVAQIGDDGSFYFWNHCWLGEERFCDRFPRIFRLSKNQQASIKSMGKWEEGRWVWILEWIREPRERDTDQLQELVVVLDQAAISADKSDGWKWNASPNDMFFVKSVYTTLSMTATANHSHSEKPEFTLIWKTPASQKAKTTAWRVLKERMATCDNLQRRQVNIPSSEAVCILCKTHLETTEHLFFTCQNSVDIWNDVLSWLGKKATLHHKAKDHFLAFRSIGEKEEEKLYSKIWICTIWCVWKGRNEGKFNQGVWNKDRIVAEIKSRLWGWNEAFNLTNAAPNFRSWFINAES